MKKLSSVIIIAVLSLLLNGCVDEETTASDHSTWLTDTPSALGQAKAEQKYILMNFSGSDWCGWCIKLDKDVFSQPEFIEYASENLVSVLVDFPQSDKQSNEQKAANKVLAEQYNVEGFPTVIILDPQGELVARTGYIQGDAATYVEHIKSLIADNQ